MPTTLEELIALVLVLQERLAIAEARVVVLERENAELRVKLGKNENLMEDIPRRISIFVQNYIFQRKMFDCK